MHFSLSSLIWLYPVEYDSNLAFFFGRYLRKYNRSWVQFNPKDWKDFFEVDLQGRIFEELEDHSNVLNDHMEKNQRDTKVALECQTDTFLNNICGVKENIRSIKEDISGVHKEIGDLKQDVRKEIGGVKENIGEVKLDLENRMEQMEGIMNKVLSLLEQSSPTAATL